jgi:hypothetical protein
LHPHTFQRGYSTSFLFYYIFTETPTKELERNFSIWADELRAIGELSDVETQRKKLNDFVADHFQKGMAAKEQALTDALRRYTLDSMQQYRTRYLLSKLTQFVDMAYNGQKTPGPLSEYATLEIEHILPDNPEPSLLDAWARENPGAAYDKYKIKLGNLTLLEKPINIVASNDFFSKKKHEYTKAQHYLTSSIAGINTVGQNSSINRINAKLKAFDHWTIVSIDERQELLIGLARDVSTTWRARTALQLHGRQHYCASRCVLRSLCF